jgi:hypothetical protein
VLRVAAQRLTLQPNVDYFASYEIVTALGGPSEMFEADRRTVRAAAVDRVMTSFFRHYATDDGVTMMSIEATPHASTVQDPCDDEFFLRSLHAERLGES